MKNESETRLDADFPIRVVVLSKNDNETMSSSRLLLLSELRVIFARRLIC